MAKTKTNPQGSQVAELALEIAAESAYRNGNRQPARVRDDRAAFRSVAPAEAPRSEASGSDAAAQARSEKAADPMPSSPTGYVQVLKRQGFAWLLAAQALAVFDDQTFKQLLILYIAARSDVGTAGRGSGARRRAVATPERRGCAAGSSSGGWGRAHGRAAAAEGGCARGRARPRRLRRR